MPKGRKTVVFSFHKGRRGPVGLHVIQSVKVVGGGHRPTSFSLRLWN